MYSYGLQKLSCHRKTARCLVSLKIIKNDTLQYVVCKSLLVYSTIYVSRRTVGTRHKGWQGAIWQNIIKSSGVVNGQICILLTNCKPGSSKQKTYDTNSWERWVHRWSVAGKTNWAPSRNRLLEITLKVWQWDRIIIIIIIIIIITDLYSAFRSEDTEALGAAQED